jgi:hypothetical protein
MKTIALGPFKGINTRLPDFALSSKDPNSPGDWLREAVNVDIDNAGRLRRRRAATLIQALTAPHSLFTAKDGTRYLVLSSVLYRITLPSYSQSMVAVLSGNDPVRYLEEGGSLYWSNGIDSGRIESGINFPIGLPTPAAPSASTVVGTLPAGSYQIAVAHYNSITGEEGGVSASTAYSLAANGGIRVALPSPVTGATHVNVYVSTLNGSVPMLVASVVAGATYRDVLTEASITSGREASQRYEDPLPAGVLFMHNGRLCSFSGSSVYIGVPYRYGYYVPSEGYMLFKDAVTNAVSAQNGVFITTEANSYWLAGTDALDVQGIVDVLPYGAVPGTAFTFPHSNKVGWFGAQGFVIGNPTGEVSAVMADTVQVTPPASGVSAVMLDREYRRVVSCGWCMNLETFATTEYDNYDFTSISGNYATLAGGIYDLTATGEVTYTIRFGRENFGTDMLKHLPAAYLDVASDKPMALLVQLPNETTYTYDARSYSTELRVHRIDTGKGLRANWYDLSLIGESDFTLASVSFAPVASSRRI